MKKIDLNLNKNIFSLLIEFECYDDLFILKERPNLTKYLNSYNLIFKSLKNNENKMQKICDEINDWFNFFNKNKKINSYNYSECLFSENVLKETKILNIDEKFIEKLNNEQDFKILPNILLFQLNKNKFNISETNNYCLKIDLEINSDNLLKTIIEDNLNYMNGNKNHNFYELIKKNVFLILKNHFSEIKNLYFFNMDKINETYLYVMNWKFKSEKLAIKDLEITNKIKKINFEKNIRFFQDANENKFFDFIKTSALDLYCFCINSKINHSINKLENWTKKAEFWVDKLKREFNSLSSSDKQRKKGYLNNINPIDFEVNKNKNPFEEKYSNLINEIWEKTEDYIDECNFWINFFDDLEIPKFLNKIPILRKV
ncbi:hypothetical protein [Mycoplasmopsis gallinarum]|uniref:Uncharacterized protein n=1 Tax=Mycoplasmopsis gallinarum TaxID=29557 RepID=A0A168RF52_9BACT|nr:hypothetical protein [Mycoplasmopsis gallinarum]OAB48920.1 hypothetical protein MGALLINA_03340 [Mycoplasmopsis gallinarum]